MFHLKIQNSHYRMTLSEETGTLTSFSNGRKEFVVDCGHEALLTIRLRDGQGNVADVASGRALWLPDDPTRSGARYRFESLGGLAIHADVAIECPSDDPRSYWHLTVHNDTELTIEWIDFPRVVVPNDLVAAGGDARILWPVGEGVLIEDAQLRDATWLNYKPLGYPSKGWDGYFPCSAQTQFMAYYGEGGGLYFGAHDENASVKMLEFYQTEQGVRLEHRVFAGAAGRGEFRMGYPVVLGVFDGDWHDAADLYREFYLHSGIEKPPRLIDNSSIPDWMRESPVVVTYPVRGRKDTGTMEPNPDYYPYTNALPHLAKLSEELDSKVMALLMQWEGTAPWAPPYVWPPYGDSENFAKFVDALHRSGNLAGVYASGIAWTNESLLEPQYNRSRQFEEERLADSMCVGPGGELLHSLICNGNIRWGHDICVSTEFARDVVRNEIVKIAESGCDYIQYFDQMHGGGPCFCYSAEHGHPPGPGIWMKTHMERLLGQLHEALREAGRNVVLGCESAAAEPYIRHLMFNDVRFEINLFYGKPVPVYAYLYHEFVNNFMGNQNNSTTVIDIEKSPLNLLQRIAYSFVAGDMLTVVLKDKGQIHWDWCTDWEVEPPEQEPVTRLLRTLNAWRRGAGKPYLCYGRMLKPLPIEGVYPVPLVMKDGRRVEYPSLMTSRWVSPDGRTAQIVVNYTMERQSFTVPEWSGEFVRTLPAADGLEGHLFAGNAGLPFDIEPLSAVLLEEGDGGGR